MQVTFSVNWQVQLSRNLRLTAINLADMTPFYKDAVDIVHDRSNQVFKAEWSNVEKNEKWVPLKPKTLIARSKRWGQYKATPNNPATLRWTGKLQDNIKKTILSSGWKLEYLQPYAIYHQDWWKNLPRRAIIDLSNATNNLIIKALQKKIQKDVGIFGKQI